MKTVKFSAATCDTTTNNNQLFDLNIVTYSDKSICLTGDYCQKISNSIKELGGKYNAHLDDSIAKNGKGWIFKAENADKVKYFVALQRVNYFDSIIAAALDTVNTAINLGASETRAKFCKSLFVLDSVLNEYRNQFTTAL